MDKRILVKEIDKLVSVVNQGRVITEYIIYCMMGDVKLVAHTELGDEAMKVRVSELALLHGKQEDNYQLPVDFVSFEEMYNIKPKQ